jgi:hypothetical protein
MSQKDEKLGLTVLMEFEMCMLLRRAAIIIIIIMLRYSRICPSGFVLSSSKKIDNKAASN